MFFPASEYKHVIEDTNSGPDAPDLEIVMCPAAPAAVRTYNKLLDKDLYMYQILVTSLR